MEQALAYEMNAFAPYQVAKGQLDLDVNLNNFAGLVDSTQTTALMPGDPVSIVGTSAGLPHYIKAAEGSLVFGYVKWSAKQSSFKAGDMVEIASGGDVMYMEAGGALNAGIAINFKIDSGTGAITLEAPGTSAGSTIGYTMEQATAAGDLVRVYIVAPVVYAASANA